MWQIYYGADSIARDMAVAKLRTDFAHNDPNGAMLNTTILDSTATFGTLQRACDSIGFFVERRLILARHYISKADQRRKKTIADEEEVLKLSGYLPELPETTDLIFIEDDALSTTHPISILAKRNPPQTHFRQFAMPDNISTWIITRARLKDSEIQPQAAQLLSTRVNRGNKNDRDHFADDTRLYLRRLDTELDKLSAYALGRTITPADVLELVAEDEVADIFKFTDAMSQRRTSDAYKIVRGILARGEHPLVLLSMIQRQTRLLISAKENEGLTGIQLGEKLGMHAFPAGKALEQARRFTMPELENAHRAVLNADEAIKTGNMDDVTALDVLIAEIGGDT